MTIQWTKLYEDKDMFTKGTNGMYQITANNYKINLDFQKIKDYKGYLYRVSIGNSTFEIRDFKKVKEQINNLLETTNILLEQGWEF